MEEDFGNMEMHVPFSQKTDIALDIAAADGTVGIKSVVSIILFSLSILSNIASEILVLYHITRYKNGEEISKVSLIILLLGEILGFIGSILLKTSITLTIWLGCAAAMSTVTLCAVLWYKIAPNRKKGYKKYGGKVTTKHIQRDRVTVYMNSGLMLFIVTMFTLSLCNMMNNVDSTSKQGVDTNIRSELNMDAASQSIIDTDANAGMFEDSKDYGETITNPEMSGNAKALTVLGVVLNYFSFSLIIISRIPQLFKVSSRLKVEKAAEKIGIAPKVGGNLLALSFMLLIFANVFSCAAVVLIIDKTTTLVQQLPWLICTGSCIILDTVLCIQFAVMEHRRKKQKSKSIHISVDESG